MPQIDSLVTSVTEMSPEERVQEIINRRDERREHDEDAAKLDREVTERDNSSSSSRFEQIIEGMSPEQAQSIMETLEE